MDTKPSLKFYQAENCNRHIRSGAFVFEFQPTTYVGGCWFGIFATSDPAAQRSLADLVSNPRNGISEITEAQYVAERKKKVKDALDNYSPLAMESLRETLPIRPTPSGRPAQVVENPEPSEVKQVSSEPLPSANDALDVGEVK